MNFNDYCKKKSNHHWVRILQGIPIGIADDVDYCHALLVENVHKFFFGSFNNFLALFQMVHFEACICGKLINTFNNSIKELLFTFQSYIKWLVFLYYYKIFRVCRIQKSSKANFEYVFFSCSNFLPELLLTEWPPRRWKKQIKKTKFVW